MHSIEVAEARLRSAELLRRVQAGEEVVATEQNEPVARIVPAALPAPQPRFGPARGLLTARDDFDDLAAVCCRAPA